jgi:hypothetical protein
MNEDIRKKLKQKLVEKKAMDGDVLLDLDELKVSLDKEELVLDKGDFAFQKEDWALDKEYFALEKEDWALEDDEEIKKSLNSLKRMAQKKY